MGCAYSSDCCPGQRRITEADYTRCNDAAAIHTGPEMALDELQNIRDHRMQPVLDAYAQFRRLRPEFQEALEILKARVDEVSLLICTKDPEYNDQSKKIAQKLLVACVARYDGTTPIAELIALRDQTLKPVITAVERDRQLLTSPAGATARRRVAAVERRLTLLECLIDDKRRVEPIPLVPATFADVAPQTVAALVPPARLPHELELLSLMRGDIHRRVACRACTTGLEALKRDALAAVGLARTFGKARVSAQPDERSQPVASSSQEPVWVFESSRQSGLGGWECFDARMSRALEAAHADGPGAVVHVTASGGHEEVINLDHMQMTSVLTGEVRRVMRRAVPTVGSPSSAVATATATAADAAAAAAGDADSVDAAAAAAAANAAAVAHAIAAADAASASNAAAAAAMADSAAAAASGDGELGLPLGENPPPPGKPRSGKSLGDWFWEMEGRYLLENLPADDSVDSKHSCHAA